MMYADRVTAAMTVALGETNRRRALQTEYNAAHGITPTTIRKALLDPASGASDYVTVPILARVDDAAEDADRDALIEALRSEMLLAAENLDFERAAALRDRLAKLEPGSRTEPTPKKKSRKRR